MLTHMGRRNTSAFVHIRRHTSAKASGAPCLRISSGGLTTGLCSYDRIDTFTSCASSGGSSGEAHTKTCVSICTFVPVKQAAAASVFVLCTSKASCSCVSICSRVQTSTPTVFQVALALQLRHHLYFCTSKASKLSTCAAAASVFVILYQ